MISSSLQITRKINKNGQVPGINRQQKTFLLQKHTKYNHSSSNITQIHCLGFDICQTKKSSRMSSPMSIAHLKFRNFYATWGIRWQTAGNKDRCSRIKGDHLKTPTGAEKIAQAPSMNKIDGEIL
jgi:hypothetical protein